MQIRNLKYIMKQINKSIASIGLMALMLVFSAQISAKDITYPCQKLIEKGEYDKAKESLSKLRDKDNNNCEVHYGFSKFYMSKDSRYSLREANKSMKKAEECFQKADEKTLKKLQKIGYSADLFKEEFSKIRQMALQDIQTQKTVASCEVFLDIFPDDEEVLQVKNQQYKFAFADAQKLNTLKAYEDFLFNYPQAPQYTQAQSTVYEMAYAEAQKKGTEAAYREYIKKYPESPKLDEAQQAAEKARKKEERAAFQKAVSEAYSSGRFGDNKFSWTYKDGELTIWGEGDIDLGYEKPWEEGYQNGHYLSGTSKSVTSLVIRPGITGLSGYVFSYCENCKKITIPYTLTKMGKDVISARCQTIVFNGPMQEWLNLNPIGASKNRPTYTLYVDGEKVTDLAIPSSVTVIPAFAFANCTSIKTVTSPNNLLTIGASAFEGCKNMRSIFLGLSLQSVGDKAFSGCEELSSIKIPETVTTMGKGVFRQCYNLPVVDDIRYADTYCIGAIERNLSSYTVKKGTRWIEGGAFYRCSKMASITIPASVVSIGGDAFEDCSSLFSVYFQGDLQQWCAIERGATKFGGFSYDLYINGELLEDFVIPEGITTIQPSAFGQVRNLQTVTLPNSVTSIGEQAFKGCENLTSITFSNNLETIGYEAFRECSQLAEVYLPRSVVKVGQNAFVKCVNMKKLTLTNPQLSIGHEAFYECDGLLELYYPKEWENKQYWYYYVSQTKGIIVQLIPLK